MTTRSEQIIGLLTAVARPFILEKYTPSSCVASTRIALDVLGHFGIEAKPETVSLMVFNQKLYKRMIAARSADLKPFRSGEWSVGIGYGYDPRRLDENNAFNGHMVAVAPRNDESEILIDLSLDQCSRPEHKMVLEPFAVVLPKEWRTEPMSVTAGNARCIYNPITTRSYHLSPDWCPISDTAHLRREVVEQIIAAMEKILATAPAVGVGA